VGEGDRLNELSVRIVSGVIMIGIALAAALQGGDFFALLVAAAATAMFWEWWMLTRSWGPRWTVAGFVYALLPAIALLWIRERYPDAGNPIAFLLLWVFIVSWASDIGAYAVGRAIGRNKLAPSISPGKTVEGLFGGIVAAGLGSAAWAVYAGLPELLLILAPLFAVAAQMGDLFESWIKRRAGVKDSSHWLPGHGGLLDRVDGLLAVAPVVALLSLVGGSSVLTWR
jgi:phosphatidate cytidylyltransferase